MMKEGFVMLPRSIQQHPFWSGEKSSRGQAMVDLLCLQSFTSHQVQICGHVIDLEGGDFAASVRFLADRWGWSVRKVASFLARFEVDKFLVKKRNDTGNGSPSVYHIVDHDTCTRSDDSHGNGSGNTEDTVGIRLGDKTNKGKKGEKGKSAGSAIAVEDSLSGFSSADQDLIRRTLSTIAATPNSRLSTQAAKNSLASKLARFPKSAVMTGCQAYLDRDCAYDGKNEKYLLGIVRNIAKKSEGNPAAPQTPSPRTTEGQRAMDRAMADLRKEHQNVLPE